MTHYRNWLLAFVLACTAQWSLSAHAEQVPLSDDNFSALVGSWHGVYLTLDEHGAPHYQTDVDLMISGAGPADGKASFKVVKDDSSWDSAIQLKDGEAVMEFYFADREFVLNDSGGNKTLLTHFASERDGAKEFGTLLLVKQGGM
jgi:hypothetical protein